LNCFFQVDLRREKFFVESAFHNALFTIYLSKRNFAKGTKTFIHLQPHEDAIAKLAEFALKKVKTGSVLIITPEEREKHFWQYDHVRLFGLDYPDWLRSVGFNIEDSKFCSFVTGKMTDTYDFVNFKGKLFFMF
jgi:hypothetical protein